MPDTQFVVERLNWRPTGASDGGFVRHPGAARVAAFDAADAAEACRREHEDRARLRVNPFAAGRPLADLTGLPEPVFRDWLLDHGVDPPAVPASRGRKPPDTAAAWAEWWAAQSAGWSAEARDAVWRGLDKVRFYRVVEKPRRAVVYALVQVPWGYNDEWYYPTTDEGGVPTTTVYRTRQRAEAERDRLNAAARRQWGGGGYALESWYPAAVDPLAAPPPDPENDIRAVDDADVPFYDVVEVEWEGPA